MPAATLVGIAQLSTTERIQLVEDIWDTIAAHPEALSLSEAQTQELDRRLDAYHKNPHAGASWQNIQQRVRSQK